MVRIFGTPDSYVDFLTSLALDGDVLCTTYLPSALFPKDSIGLFFSRVEHARRPDAVAEALWSYGRKAIRSVLERKTTLCIESACMREFCRSGIVHEASPRFTTTYPTRAAVLKTLQELNKRGNVYVTPGPLPYVFRLHPPNGVLIDIQRNVAAQMVQGMYIEDGDAFARFQAESRRLIDASRHSGTGDALDTQIRIALERFARAEHYEWSS